MSTEYKNYIVVFTPHNKGGVDDMRVVDSWGSTGDLKDAAVTMWRRIAEDPDKLYSKHGYGTFTVCECGRSKVQ